DYYCHSADSGVNHNIF
nr:immunoglobulin light chain junction region [Macaca mulatta]MOX47293.1 immunoglobulin light chain junction region [Macaca mulatta]